VDQALDGIAKAIKLMDSDEEWKAGDRDFVICKDGIVIKSLDYDWEGELKISVEVIVGKPKIADIELGLLEEED
jgi:hypothetical protein